MKLRRGLDTGFYVPRIHQESRSLLFSIESMSQGLQNVLLGVIVQGLLCRKLHDLPSPVLVFDGTAVPHRKFHYEFLAFSFQSWKLTTENTRISQNAFHRNQQLNLGI
jgi:hypothetical protein